MIGRRSVLAGLTAGSATLAAPSLVRAQSRTTLDVYVDGDTNIQDLWNNIVKPAFERAHPGNSFRVTVTRGVGSGNRLIAERALAAMETRSDPRVDLFEEYDPRHPAGSIAKGLWVEFTRDRVPGVVNLNPLSADLPQRLPYRGSQVLLAYDGAKVKEAPKTWADLVAWAKRNPGRFTYGRPDRGGSGRNFVVRAVHEANGRDPGLFRADNFDAKLAEERFGRAWALLRDLHPHTYGQGAYPAGNTPALQLLAQGAVDMIAAWSDQAIQAIAQGVLPPTTKLVQLQDLGLCGGFAYSAIPTNARNLDLALKLADITLSAPIQTAIVKELGGFPGVDWKHLPGDLREAYIDIIPVSIPTFPSGEWNTAMNDGWYRSVATNIAR
jgi:putative spermidine/putrescine transport system substrate-binding protein